MRPALDQDGFYGEPVQWRFGGVTIPPVALVLLGILSVQFGAATSKALFDEAGPTVLVWLRLASSSAILVLLARPALRGRTREDWVVAAGLGMTLAAMNWAIYQSFARIPLGVAVTIEFVGPLAVAVIGSRRLRDLTWVGLAGGGIVILGLEPGPITWAGVGFALFAGAMWACYIVLGARTGARWPGLGGLTTASVIATLLLSAPLALGEIGGADRLGSILSPRVLGLGVMIGMLSSVIPYSFEIVALRTMPTSAFGILMSLEPAAAVLVAAIVLTEMPTLFQIVAMLCVVLASIGATRPPDRPSLPRPPRN
jgi:inner membrane transporter RhtA